MNALSILYIGAKSGTSLHRALSLKRLGYTVFHVDPNALVPSNRFADSWARHTGWLFMEEFVRQQVLASIPRLEFDCVCIDRGDLVGPSLVRDLKKRFGKVINYNKYDPFSTRDGRRWRLYLRALSLYDLIVVVRDCNVEEAWARGAQRVLRVSRAADEVAHSPRQIPQRDFKKWTTEVSFVGTWMRERGSFMLRLVREGIPLSIYGDRWHKAPEWSELRSYWRGSGLYDDAAYASAIQCAKVNLGLLSQGNRDLSTTRSFEIPHLRGVLCTERTSEHSKLYAEDNEALFWKTPEECAAKCIKVLKDEAWRKHIGLKGRERCLQNKTTNESVMSAILSHALASA
jgi:spore maturation protein CgeB